jgi:hypothetical protein
MVSTAWKLCAKAAAGTAKAIAAATWIVVRFMKFSSPLRMTSIAPTSAGILSGAEKFLCRRTVTGVA